MRERDGWKKYSTCIDACMYACVRVCVKAELQQYPQFPQVEILSKILMYRYSTYTDQPIKQQLYFGLLHLSDNTSKQKNKLRI